jgi:hypothetical protein
MVAAREEDVALSVRKLPLPLEKHGRVGLERLEPAADVDDPLKRQRRLPGARERSDPR